MQNPRPGSAPGASCAPRSGGRPARTGNGCRRSSASAPGLPIRLATASREPIGQNARLGPVPVRAPRAAGALRRQSSTAARHQGPESPGQSAYPPRPLLPAVGRWRGGGFLSEQSLPIPMPILGSERTEVAERGEAGQGGKIGEADQFLGSDSEGQAESGDSIC